MWDARTYALWGTAPGEPIGYADCERRLHPDDRASARAAVDRALDPDGERRFLTEFRVVQPGGSLRWVETSGHVGFDGRRALRIVGTVADITERKLVDARRNEFLAILGHELRNPLAPITHSRHLLERQPGLTESARQSHAVIDRQLKHMVRLLEEMFSRDESLLSRSNGGLGVGLALAKGLTELHGGSIAVRSQGLGRGSEFVVNLPLLARVEPEGPVADRTPHFDKPLRGQRVLAVDDNHDAVQTLAALLEFDGAIMTIAGDGIQALRARRGAVLQVVALTGWGQAEDRALTREAGFDAHLVKPVDHHALLRAIEKPAPASTLGGG